MFDLYGLGWGKGAKKEVDKNNINKVYRGPVEDKHEVLKNYKFAFCFENSIFPGYITEKIFDVMFAGCIPVYCGAPDIKKIVPSDCFVDLRDFKNFSDMTAFLESINEQVYANYITNIKNFLNYISTLFEIALLVGVNIDPTQCQNKIAKKGLNRRALLKFWSTQFASLLLRR